jgi:hypothetical protein
MSKIKDKSVVFLSSFMVIENDLSVVRRIDLSSSDIFIEFAFGVDVDDFTIPLISEKETGLPTTGIDLKVG